MSEDWIRDPESARMIEERTRQSSTARYSREPAAKLLKYYEYHDNERLTCPRCGWTGQGQEASSEHHRELFDVSCPSCDKMLLVVSYPTTGETREAAAAGNAQPQNELPNVERVEARWARTEELELKADSELPELSGDELRFTWDFEQDDNEEVWTIIRCGEQIVWRELAYWEGRERFNAVKALLKSRFGERFQSMTPTDRSELYLFGDDIFGREKLETT